jgi:hypothetical protein
MNGPNPIPSQRGQAASQMSFSFSSSSPDLKHGLKTMAPGGFCRRTRFFGRVARNTRWRFSLAVPLVCLVLLAGTGLKLMGAATNAPVTIALSNQWEKPAELRAPLDRITLLTVADRAGAKQINAWVEPLKARYGTNVHFFAVADVHAVPSPLRAFVRRRFAKEYSYPIGLDWQGVVSAQMDLKPGVANLFLLDRDARVRLSLSGLPDAQSLNTFSNRVNELIQVPPKVSTTNPVPPNRTATVGPSASGDVSSALPAAAF